MKKQIVNQSIEAFIKEKEEWKTKYLRALADYQNLEKRTVSTRNEEIKLTSRHIILKLLPICDALEKLQAHLQDQSLELILKQFHALLKQENVQRIEAVVGKNFDPHFMECIDVVEGEEAGQVVEELQPGYFLNNLLIRAVRVKVGKGLQKKDDITQIIPDGKNQ